MPVIAYWLAVIQTAHAVFQTADDSELWEMVGICTAELREQMPLDGDIPPLRIDRACSVRP